MASLTLTASAYGVGNAARGSAPSLREYQHTHKVRGAPLLGRLELQNCTRLILYNVQGFTVPQVWTELRATLGELSRSIVQIKRVSGLNRNPHMDLWVREDSGAALVNVIREQTKARLWSMSRVITEARRRNGTVFPTLHRLGNEERFENVTHWRIALWQPWRERRYEPARPPPQKQSSNLTSVATWNINGFWSKQMEMEDFLSEQKIAVLALQETLVKASHYTIQMNGYKAYQTNAEVDFRGCAMLVDQTLASYEVPHGLSWLIHVKVFGFAGWSGPTHFINVYLKSGGNFRRSRGESLNVVKGIVHRIIMRTPDARFIVMGDFNEEGDKVMKHLNSTEEINDLTPAFIVGSTITRFPRIGGKKRALDHILLNDKAQMVFRNARVHREYSASDHRPVVIRPRRQLPPNVETPARPNWDNKMIRLKGDLIANDNSWTLLMTQAFGEDFLNEEHVADEVQNLVSTEAERFINTFDQVCKKHSAKKEHQPRSKRRMPRKLRNMLQVVKRYSAKYNKCRGTGRGPEDLDVIRLARAQKRFKKAKKAWDIQLKQKFYSQVANDFVAHDHKGVWDRLNSQLKPNAALHSVSPIRDKEGMLQYRAEDILAAIKDHYQDVFTHDPKGISQDFAYWEAMDLGEPLPPLELNEGLGWPEILITIRGMNRNTAPGKDGVHVNVLKILVLEECMAEVKRNDNRFIRPDNVRIDLPFKKLPTNPLTPMGKAFYALLLRTWESGCIPSQWNEVEIINLFKGGDPEQTTNYRGISLISCAFKVLMALMAARLSVVCEEKGLIANEQAGFRSREEAVAQAIALAEIVRRRYLKGKPTFGLFIDFKKAYDRVYHGYLFRVLDHIGIRGRFLTLLRNMYLETKYSIRVGNFTSESFSPTRGAKQGDPLSPILFILFINDLLSKGSSTKGVNVPWGREGMGRCPGLMYADDVIALENSLEDTQRTLDGIWEWGQTYGMDLGHDKCGVICWPSDLPHKTRVRTCIDFDSDCSSIISRGEHKRREQAGEDWWTEMRVLEFQHDHYIYSTPDGVIPTVKHYKYLGIVMDTRLGNPRKVIVGERSMELEFAHLQASKGLKVLHSLRPFLTDRFCPIVLKVAMVRNLVYSKMLYGAEFIGFQALHAEPMQRVINMAAKWILGLQKHNTSTDAFTLCYELGLPPVHQELCAMRARLCYKLEAHTEGGLHTWIQRLWDLPPTISQNRHSWVSQSQKWLAGLEKDKNKYAGRIIIIPETGQLRLDYLEDQVAPLRPWVQLGKSCEMRVRANAYHSPVHNDIRAAFLGENEYGEPWENPIEPEWGYFPAEWDLIKERKAMDEGRNVPPGRTRAEVTKVNLVRDVVLERMMHSQRTKGFTNFYDIFNFGVTRGFLREAANRPDLAEGVRWLCLARTRAFPSVEGAWQRIKRSGKEPVFERGLCPLCSMPVSQGWEWAHLLVQCTFPLAVDARETHINERIQTLRENIEGGNPEIPICLSEDVGGEDGTKMPITLGAASIQLIGGLYRSLNALNSGEWFNTYFIGFGHLRMITPSFDTFHFISVASFFQTVAPSYVNALGGNLYGDWTSPSSQSESSLASSVNQRHHWFTEGFNPIPDEGRNARVNEEELGYGDD